jgi:Kef-type K+ transport system membrane component KefB
MLLAVVVQLASAAFEWVALLLRLGLVAAYCAGCWFVLRPALRAFVSWAGRREAAGGFAVHSAVFAFVLLSAWITSALGLHSAFGALLAGLLLREEEIFVQRWNDTVGGFVSLALVPVFFAYAGCHANMGALESARFIPCFLLFFAAAVAGKFGGCYLSARICGIEHRQARLVGALMNTRGLMELIVLTIGLDMHILPPEVYAMLMLMAIGTTLMTVPLVRLWSPVRLLSSMRGPHGRQAAPRSSAEA